MKACLRKKTQQDEELSRFPITLASDGIRYVIKPQDWKVLILRCKDDRREIEQLGLGLKYTLLTWLQQQSWGKNLFSLFKIHAPLGKAHTSK
jgi:hypothetical protein